MATVAKYMLIENDIPCNHKLTSRLVQKTSQKDESTENEFNIFSSSQKLPLAATIKVVIETSKIYLIIFINIHSRRLSLFFFDGKQRIYGSIINNVNKNFVLASQILSHRHRISLFLLHKKKEIEDIASKAQKKSL